MINIDKYVIMGFPFSGYLVLKNGWPLTERKGTRGRFRVFRTRNSARKRIARERSGDFHK